MKEYKSLKIKGAILDKNQLESYLEKIASDHMLQNKSNKTTYPIPRVKENFEVISQVYSLLNEHVKLNIPIHPAGEWILDNFYMIEETVKTILKDLTIKKYTNFLGITNGMYQGFARIYVLASEIVAYTDCKIDSKTLESLLMAYQSKKTLSMDEIWNIGLFLQIAILENIKEICEKIYSSQMQKYKAENILERLVEQKDKNGLKYKMAAAYKTKMTEQSEMKYSFIEYMSYRLKRYGKQSIAYLNILEEQVNKTGTNISEIIRKEHFDIAVKKVSIGNCITSIKNLLRINFLEIFEKINGVEDILKQDPIGQYEKMDYKTKAYYRNTIKEIANKTKVSEIYIAKQCLLLAQEANGEKQSHVGYYLIADGKKKLYSHILNKPMKETAKDKKVKIYLSILSITTIIISFLLSWYIQTETNQIIFSILVFLAVIIPVESIVIQMMQYVLSKTVKPKMIPKLDFQNGIPEEDRTMVVIPTIVKDPIRVKELIKKLEVFYIANKSENIYFTLLGDCSSSKNEKEQFDEAVIQSGMEEIKKLNQKYPDSIFAKFQFIYRHRIWNEKEGCYLGWERKRGLLNQFNEYVLQNIENPFRINTMEELQIPKIKYIITLDADTDLSLNAGLELIGAMAHVLNKPELNEKRDLVVAGHGLLQPRIGISLLASRKSMFTKIFAGSAGTDSYTNAISDVYQDNFEEGIFTGKGIYDLPIFSEVLKNEIPENTVLSHDLLEGCYLRCGLVSDIMLMDGYPVSYNSFKTRLHRWIRGDYQILPWLKRNSINRDGEKKKNPLGLLCKYKIWDNIMRSQTEIMILFSLILVCVLDITKKVDIWPIVTTLFIASCIPTILDFISRITGKQEGEEKQKTFTPVIHGIYASFLRGILAISVLPDKAYMSFSAACITIYRMIKTKKHLLEWTTAEEAEKTAKKDLFSYYKNMISNIVMGVIGIIFLCMYERNWSSIFIFLISILWLIAPILMWNISKEQKEEKILSKISKEEQKYLYDIGERTWLYFKENLTPRGHFLPPDNYQEDRKQKLIYRTSPTNVGLALLAVISSYDMGYENIEDTMNLLNHMIETISNLPKWNGHLYNWYNIETLEPLNPQYISSVDSGNFVGYLYVVKQFLETILEEQKVEKEKTEIMIQTVDHFIEHTDFKKVYDEEKRLFSIGFNVEENKLTDSYYDLLASEARQASFVAIAKKDISSKHWYNLSRTLTTLNKYKGLISWSGTAFEYLMPNINIPKYPSSLLDESCKFLIMSQKQYSKKLGIPWGISESAFNLKDLNHNYQYKAFGIPWLGLKRGLADEMVVSSYGTMLALPEDTKAVIDNLKILEKEGMYNKYGFYESIDYTPSRVEKGKNHAIVKTYMAHHQGLTLLSINNTFHENILQKRFMDNPEIKAVQILLEEKMPENIIITKEEKEKIEKIKYADYENYTERVYTKMNDKLNITNVISNENYTIVMDQKGNGYSKYKDITINRFKETDDEDQGILFYMKDIKTKRIWTSHHASYLAKADRYAISFTPDMDKITRTDGNMETITKTITAPNEPVEIRRIELTNHGMIEETIEITAYMEPILSDVFQDYAHKAFNNLFLSCEYISENGSIVIKRRPQIADKGEIYLAVNFYTENETIGELEYEIEKEKFFSRGNLRLPKLVETSSPFSSKMGYTTDPIIAMKRTITIEPEETVKLDFIISVSEERKTAIQNMEKFRNSENSKRTFELSKARLEAETRYLGLKGTEIETYQKMLSYLLFTPKVSINEARNSKKGYSIEELWKYGISGDLPIVLIKIKDTVDIDIIKDALNAYEYFRVKNIMIDLVILNEEKESYESYVKEAIQTEILNKNISYLQNIKGGIFVLNNIDSKEDKHMLEFRAKLIFNAHSGNIKQQMKELEEDILEKVKEVGNEEKGRPIIEEENHTNLLKDQELLYYNEYGGFSKDGKEYKIRVNQNDKTPTVWSHVIANEHFGTVVTESMGGYTWDRNSRLNRLTAWSNSQVIDVPSEIIYLEEEESKKIWSLGVNPMPDENDYYVTYGLGYANYFHESMGIKQDLDMFIPKDHSIKINLLHLKNTKPQKKTLKVIYYIKPVIGEDEIKSNGYIYTEYNQNSNLLLARNTQNVFNNDIVYISSSEKINSYTNNKAFFIGNGGITNPEGIRKLELNKERGSGNDTILAIEFKVTLEAFSSKDISIILGLGKTQEECQDIAYQFTNIHNCEDEYGKIKKYWTDLTEQIQVDTPLTSTNLLLNRWLIYQTLCSRMWAKSGYYQSGGALGFRDQLQDSMAIKYVNTEISKNQIIKHAKNQFIEGDVQHWWHEETQRGIRTRFADDLLWLPFVTANYVEYTNDYGFLDTMATYKKGPVLEEGTDEKYDLYLDSDIKETIYEHCIRAIEKSLQFGENGIPKIGSGDWNDGLNTVGNKGKGESVWLGFFLYDVLKKFIPICEYKKELEKVTKYQAVMESLKKALNNNCWDGRWYKRAFMDDGNVLGSLQNEECRIDSISQSWATISGAGDNDKKYISMESLENHLVDRENSMIKLLDPPFEKSKLEPGYIKSYLPGTRENGGQYTHAAVWAVIAEALLGFGDKANEYFRMINPIEHARTKEAAGKYKAEPYVVAADIYGSSNLAGRGGWTWYTGSSAWMYIAGVKYLLGLRIHNGYLWLEPSIPKDWKEYSIRYKYQNSIYHIKVKNPNNKNTGVTKVILNGEEQEEKKIRLQENGVYTIEIEM